MSARKDAWAIVSAEMHRHLAPADPDGEYGELTKVFELIDGVLTEQGDDAVWLMQEVAGFAVTALLRYAEIAGKDPLALMQAISLGVARESDEDEEDDAA